MPIQETNQIMLAWKADRALNDIFFELHVKLLFLPALSASPRNQNKYINKLKDIGHGTFCVNGMRWNLNHTTFWSVAWKLSSCFGSVNLGKNVNHPHIFTTNSYNDIKGGRLYITKIISYSLHSTNFSVYI